MQPLRSKHDAIATVGSKPGLRIPEMVMCVWCNKNSRRVKQRLGRKTTSWASGIRTRRMFSYGARSTEKVNAGWDRQGNVKLKFKLVQDYNNMKGADQFESDADLVCQMPTTKTWVGWINRISFCSHTTAAESLRSGPKNSSSISRNVCLRYVHLGQEEEL